MIYPGAHGEHFSLPSHGLQLYRTRLFNFPLIASFGTLPQDMAGPTRRTCTCRSCIQLLHVQYYSDIRAEIVRIERLLHRGPPG